jgi:hypothetical protein
VAARPVIAATQPASHRSSWNLAEEHKGPDRSGPLFLVQKSSDLNQSFILNFPAQIGPIKLCEANVLGS